MRTESPSFLIWHPTLRGVFYTAGADSCHLAVIGDSLVTVEYGKGSISVYGLDPRTGSVGGLSDRVTEDLTHPHMVAQDRESVLVSDLGRDAVYRYKVEEGKLAAIGKHPVAGGPRHFLHLGESWYVVCEVSGELAIFDERWNPISRVQGLHLPSDIVASADGRFLYTASRGPDTIHVLTREGAIIAEVPTRGKWPRHLAVDGERLYVSNQHSHNVTIFRLDPETGVPVYEAEIVTPSPSCVLVG